MRTHVGLFEGIGAVSIAAEHAGYTTTVVVEKDPFCRRVLAKRFPRATILEDVTEVTGDDLRRASAGGDASGSLPTIDQMSGGFP